MARGRTTAAPVSRAAALAYRLAAHDLVEPVTGWPGVLEVGVRDSPPGSTVPPALRSRSTSGADPYADADLALVHGVRGAMHLHRAADLPSLAAALRPDDAAELLVSTHGPFFQERAAEGLPVGEVFDVVAAAMARVMADGRERTKGELSGAVTPLVPAPVAPWCGGCGAHHVHDGLFRMASLQAGLRLRPAGLALPGLRGSQAHSPPPAGPGSAIFLPAPTGEVPAAGAARGSGACRRSWVRRFLRRCGPTTPGALAAWLGLAPPAARRWWSPLKDELTEVRVEEQRLWVHRDDLDALTGAGPPVGVLLLAPYDPILEIAERSLLLPDPTRRRQVWRAVANPGVLLIDGEVAGVWRRRRSSARVAVTVTGFAPLPDRRRRAVVAAAEAMFVPTAVTVGFES